MAESADARDLKSLAGNSVTVQVCSAAPARCKRYDACSELFVYRKPLARRVVQEKTYVDNEEIETPFAIIGVRSANCTNKQREVIQK